MTLTYQEILQDIFDRRRALNPRYSLRAFAGRLGLQPSKLSEILSLKKGLSLARAEEVIRKLDLSPRQSQIFLLSVTAQHARTTRDRTEAGRQLSILLKEKTRRRGTQRNAWYFGAVQALEKSGVTDDEELQNLLGITALQVENAKRYLKRMERLYPDVEEIRYEPASILRKLEDSYSSRGGEESLHTVFGCLDAEDLEEIKAFVREKAQKRNSREHPVLMINLSTIRLTEGDQPC